MACGCFTSTICWKYRFLSKFRWGIPWLRHFLGDSFGVLRNKASTASYDTAFGKGSAIATDWYAVVCNSRWTLGKFFCPITVCGCFFSTTYWKYKFLFCPSSVGSWVAHFYWLFFWLCYSLWLFHPHSTMKIQPFFPSFPLAGSTAKAFCRLFLWNSKEKSVSHFLWHSHWKKADEWGAAYREAVKKRMRFWARPRHGMWLFYLYNMLKIQVFIQISLRDSMIEAFFGGFLWSFKK